MDPNANLARQRELIAEIRAQKESGDYIDATHRAAELAELVEALDTELFKGGTLPAEWQATQHAAW